MKLILKGHDYKYASEQMLLSLFPGEKPEYSEAEPESSAEISLTEGAEYATAVTRLFWNGERAAGTARIRLSRLTGKLRRDSLLSMAVKLSFYRAAMKILPEKPVWGALTGIRPGTIMTKLIESGTSEKAAISEMKRLYFLDDTRARLLVDTSRASIEAKRGLSERDIGIYVGIPFCPTRCA
ncbi:MAG: coproporphyrinogen dehydrogenase HemZ, partial [Oscillospiraceae bacterium]|nr:coproporphyrinogen dehydrogenase HemZ [Oscillospiraceae bacterium]